MPCMKCSNGKWKYGAGGSCVFDTLAACKRAAAAIHIQDKEDPKPEQPCSPLHDPLCPCNKCVQT